MEKYFANYNQALALKELGFYESCFAFYAIPNNENKLFFDIDPDDGELTSLNQNQIYHNNLSEVGRISAPLKQQVFEWARKEYRIISVIDFYCDNDEWEDTMYEVRISEFKHFKTHDSFVQSEYKSYEEAESACIDKLIEIVKSK